MRRPALAAGALLGSLTSLPLIALWYAGAEWAGLPFLPADLADELRRIAGWPPPGTGAWLSPLSGWAMVLAGCCGVGVLIAWVLGRTSFAATTAGLLAGLVAFAPVALVEYRRQAALGKSPLVGLLWLGILNLNWGVVLAVWLERPALSSLSPQPLGPPESQARRDLLRLAAGSLAAAAAAWGAGFLAGRFRRPAGGVLTFSPPTPLTTTTPPASGTAVPLPSTPAEASLNTEPRPASLAGNCILAPVVAPTPLPSLIRFGELDPSTGLHVTGQGKVIDASTYHLDVVGKVDQALRFTYDDLRCLPKTGHSVTVVCVGYFEDTAGWAGADLKALLQLAGVRKDAGGIRLVGADDFESLVPLNSALEGGNFLAYELEGEPLPVLHGFPVRAMFPSRYGSTDVKWLVKIEVY
jgi:hypothetical protein